MPRKTSHRRDLSNRNFKVYKHTLPVSISRKENDMIYIGITCKDDVRRRWSNGYGYRGNNYFFNSIKKYGWNNFEHEVLFEGLTKEEAEKKEIELIAFYKTTDTNFGYNVSSGGGHNGTIPERTRQLISMKNKGKVRDEEFKKRISDALKGVKKSKEFCENLSKKASIPVICIETGKEYRSALEAGRQTDIDNSSITACCTGRYKSAGGFHWIYKINATDENIEKTLFNAQNNHYRKVMCVETGKVYNTIAEAANNVGANATDISACCLGKTKSVRLCHWLYLEDVTEEKIKRLKQEDVTFGRVKPIQCINTGKIYKTAKEAQRELNITSSNIIACCRGRVKSAGKDKNGNKLYWKYYKEGDSNGQNNL